MTRDAILKCLTDRPCDVCVFHADGHCQTWNCVFEEKPDDAEPCEDAISRQAVHNLMAKLLSDYLHDEDREKIENTDAQIADLPSVTPTCSEKPNNCEDAISRHDAIHLADELKDDLPDDERMADMVMAHNEGISEYQTKLSLLPFVTPKQRWIPTSERLPEPFGHVLRTVKSIGWNGTFSIYVDIGTICPIDTDVIAWMPLPVPMIPEPHKTESEDNDGK